MIFFILVGLAVLGYIFLYPLYLGSKVRQLTKEVNMLKVRGTSGSVPLETAQMSPSPGVMPEMKMSERVPSMNQGAQVQPQFVPVTPNPFIEWLKKDFLVKLGAFLLLLGFGWFVSYAFANDWIGPTGRIMLGLLTGVLILAVGAWRVQKYLHQGSIFAVLGSSTVLLTVFAARHIYDMFTPLLALVIMFLSVTFVAFMSVRYKHFNLALASLILAGIAPLFTNAPVPDVLGLFSYILIVVLGTLWVVYLTGWKNLTFASLILVFLYGLPFLLEGAIGSVSGKEEDIALLFAFVFTAIFFIGNILSILHQRNDKVETVHLVTALGTGLYLIVWVTFAVNEEWRSLLYAAWMVVFSLGAFLVYASRAQRAAFYIYGGTSLALLAAATASELSGSVLTIAYTIEAAVVVMLSYFLLRDITIAQRLGWLFIGPIILSFESIVSPSWNSGVIHDDFFVLVILTIVLGIVGVFLYEQRKGSHPVEADMSTAFLVLCSLYALTLIWLITHALFESDSASMLSLIIYTVIGLATFIGGEINDFKTIRICGGILLGAVVVRLLLVEVWQMELTGRIITFFVIGTLLVSTAFMRRKHKSSSAPLEGSNQQGQ